MTIIVEAVTWTPRCAVAAVALRDGIVAKYFWPIIIAIFVISRSPFRAAAFRLTRQRASPEYHMHIAAADLEFSISRRLSKRCAAAIGAGRQDVGQVRRAGYHLAPPAD